MIARVAVPKVSTLVSSYSFGFPHYFYGADTRICSYDAIYGDKSFFMF